MTTYDYLIVGQGLAGTALAWNLCWRNRKVLVVDRPRASSASRVAAGLITPITGRRLKACWRFHQFWPAALRFYRRVEAETACRFFERRAALRLFVDQAERDRLLHQSAELTGHKITTCSPSIDQATLRAPYGGFSMDPAGQLDTISYLNSSRDHFAAANQYRQTHLDLRHDIKFQGDWLHVPRLAIRTRGIVFCQGIRGTTNPWFGHVHFDPSKGELLELRIPGVSLQTSIHSGIWLAPESSGRFLLGATYDRCVTDAAITSHSRVELSRQLRSLLRRSFEVVGQRAGVRPAIEGRHPVLGTHPDHRNLAFFNGLGSKGALQSPYLAKQLALALDKAQPLESEVDFEQRVAAPGCSC